MAVGSIGDESVAELLELLLDGLGILQDLFLVLLELGGIDLLEGNSQSSDGVVVRTTLVTGEDRKVDWVLEVVHDLLARLISASDSLAEEDHGSTGSTERLVGRGSDNISVLKWRWNNSSSNETGDVSHVDNEISTDSIGNLSHSSVVNETAVGRGTSNKTFWSVELSIGLEEVIVNDASLKIDLVWERLKVGRDSRDPAISQDG